MDIYKIIPTSPLTTPSNSYAEEMNDSDGVWDPNHCRWISSVYRKNYLEESVADSSSPRKILPAPSQAVYFVFGMCDRLHMPPQVSFLTIDIFEKFVSAHITFLLQSVLHLETTREGFQRRWDVVRNRVFQQIPLRLLSCMQLASKLLSAGGNSSRKTALGAERVRKILEKADLCYDINAVISSEFRVFRQVGFRLPLLSTLDTVEMILAEAAGFASPSSSGSSGAAMAASPSRWRTVRQIARGALRLAYARRASHAARLRGSAPLAPAVALAAARLALWPRPRGATPNVRALADLIVADSLKN